MRNIATSTQGWLNFGLRLRLPSSQEREGKRIQVARAHVQEQYLHIVQTMSV